MPFQIQTIVPCEELYGSVIVTLIRIDTAGNLVLRGGSVKELFGENLAVGAVVEIAVGRM